MMSYVRHWAWYKNIFPNNHFDVFNNFKYDQLFVKTMFKA